MSNKILIADDSKLVVSLVKSIFESQSDNFIVIAAYNGKEALQKAKAELPDIILMDWQMPEMTGLETLSELKKNEKTRDIPVIMLTASESTTEAFELGASDFVQKPFNKNELIARVRTSINSVNYLKELKLKTIENEIQRDKLKLQKELLVKQKKELNEIHSTAVKVKELISPNEKNLSLFFDDYFLLSLPKDDIPANFLWFKKIKQTIYFSLVFLAKENSQVALYNAIFTHKLSEYFDNAKGESELVPAEVLKSLGRALFDINATIVNLKGSTDVVFCALDIEKDTLQYAGVNLPLIVLKKDKLVELKTEKSVSGFNDVSIPYANHKVQLAKDDILYLLNNGFSEDSSESADNYYLSDQLMNVLKKVHDKDMSKQKELLNKTFESWKKDLKQIKDILVIGVKI